MRTADGARAPVKLGPIFSQMIPTSSLAAARLGAWSGTALVLVGAAYVVVLGTGFTRHGLSEPITDPILAVMEVLTIASALPVLTLCVALHAVTEPTRRVWSILALSFAGMFALTTITVHTVELTAGRQLGSAGLVWPSTTYAVELVAWDLLLGMCLLAVWAALGPEHAARRLRAAVLVTSACCLAGLSGPAVGNMRWQLIGVFGYSVLLPVVAWGMRGWFLSARTGTSSTGARLRYRSFNHRKGTTS